MDTKIVTGDDMDLESFVQIARFGAEFKFSDSYKKKVMASERLLATAISEKTMIYGISTGFGVLSDRLISLDEVAQLQENIVLSHAVSVGQPLSIEQTRAMMLMVLLNLGQGNSGVRMVLLDTIREMLARGVTPLAPKEGSVGYLAPEAHFSLVLIGKGRAYYDGELLPGGKAMEKAGIPVLTLAAGEGLSLTSGTTSVTALGAMALYDMINAAKSADIIGSMSVEALRGVMRHFDKRLMDARPHSAQGIVADNVRRILDGSGVLKHFEGQRLQDALSLRCIPQLHGAAKQMLYNAKDILETEMNSCCDNPQIFDVDGKPDVISGCNADAAYVGVAMDSAAIAATMLAKISERRNNRYLDENLSGYPSMLVKKPGLNSGLMIPQYTQAGLLGDMRILSTPSVIDNTPTCCNQEDYVSMGYNSSKKAGSVAEKLEYVLAIELLSCYQAQQFIPPELNRSPATKAVLDAIEKEVPVMEQDILLHPHIEFLKTFIHKGDMLNIVQSVVGQLQ